MSGQAFFILAAIVIVLMVIVVSIRTGGAKAAGQRGCPHCGESQPGVAKFCRRCGKPLN